jgi:ubiquinone/menaquinone biosynthesis C-methylase UbiE
MGLYARLIFPRICDWAMRNPIMNGYRDHLLANVSGEILEIGFGTGLNLAHYPAHVKNIATVDPSTGMNRIAQRRIANSGITVDARLQSGENLPFPDTRFDCVVTTWTLCSIQELGRALGEIYRVLKPGGRYFFLEHGLSDAPEIQRWQRRLNPIQRMLADGCRLDLDVASVIKAQPFQDVSIERFLMEKAPKTHGTMYRGTAIK